MRQPSVSPLETFINGLKSSGFCDVDVALPFAVAGLLLAISLVKWRKRRRPERLSYLFIAIGVGARCG